MSVMIKIDDSSLLSVQKRLKEIPKKAPNAISNSLNRTMTNVAATLSKEIRQEYTVKAADIKGTIKKRRATLSSLSAEVKSVGGVIPLDKFKTSKLMATSNKGGIKAVSLSKKTIKAEVKKGEMKKVLGAFAASLNGAKIFKRKNKKRLPINRLFGPSIPQMGGNNRISAIVNQNAEETYERRIDHEITRLLARLGG